MCVDYKWVNSILMAKNVTKRVKNKIENWHTFSQKLLDKQLMFVEKYYFIKITVVFQIVVITYNLIN